MEKLAQVIGAMVLSVLIVVLASLLLSFPTMWAWNYVMPHTFHLPEINIWGAFALNYLSGTFFKSSLKCDKDK
jgi:hypothetical protein